MKQMAQANFYRLNKARNLKIVNMARSTRNEQCGNHEGNA